MEVVVTTGAISRAKLQSNHHHQQTNIQWSIQSLTDIPGKSQINRTELFYRPNALSASEEQMLNWESKHWRQSSYVPTGMKKKDKKDTHTPFLYACWHIEEIKKLTVTMCNYCNFSFLFNQPDFPMLLKAKPRLPIGKQYSSRIPYMPDALQDALLVWNQQYKNTDGKINND